MGIVIVDPINPSIISGNSTLVSFLNSIARIGGMFVSLKFIFGGFVTCINRKLYLRSLI